MKTVSGKDLSKLGIGTYGIGGRGHRNMDLTEKDVDKLYIDALLYTFDKGLNFTEISLGYGHGEAIRLFGDALSQSAVQREDLFITHSLYPNDIQDLQTIENDIDSFYKILETNYADSTLVTQSIFLIFGEKVIYKILHRLLENKKTRYVSLSNASPTWIRKFKEEFGESFFAHEGHLSFEIRALQDKGVFETCNELEVKNIIWRPFGRNATFNRNWEILVKISQKYDKKVGQIILNWMIHDGYMPMVFSTKTEHIDENCDSLIFEMETIDYEKMNDFRPPNYTEPFIDWEGKGIDMDLVSLISNFDKNSNI